MARARDAATWHVQINGRTDEMARVLSVEESLGGRRLDTAVIEVDPESIQQTGIGVQVKPNMNDTIRISCKFAGKTYWRHFGTISEIEPHISPTGPRMRLTSRTERWHFGLPLTAVRLMSPDEDELIPANRALVFNPTIDGKDEGNCSPGEPGEKGFYFLDPESIRTPSALTLHGGKPPERWTLAKAVLYLCTDLSGGLYARVQLPKYELLKQIFDDDEYLIRNVSMRFGDYLPQCLDRLLEPLGYLWSLKKTASFHEFSFVAKGTGGKQLHLKHQRPGSVFADRSTEVENATLRYGLSNLTNDVEVYGSPERVEFTAICSRTWSASHDDLTSEELLASNPDFPDVENVYRKWIVDFAGDYTDTRPENKDARVKLKDLFSSPLQCPGRRKLGPTLTLGDDGAPIGQVQGVYVEYSNPLFPAVAGEPEFLPIGNWACIVLEKEPGVYFRGEFVPEEILRQGAAARIRITATLDSDLRLIGSAVRKQSANTDTVRLALDLADRYFDSKVLLAGTYRSRFADDVVAQVRRSNTNSDVTTIQEFAETLRNTFDTVEISGPIVLEGCDYDYQLGDQVLDIKGLELDLACNVVGSNPRQYPQISAITYDPQANTATLQLERFKSDIAPPDKRGPARRRKR